MDDFSHFFFEAKSREKKKVIRSIMKEAIAEQESLLDRHRVKELAKI